MVQLTEEMVRKTGTNVDLSEIVNFNCWGMELTDLSVLEKLDKVEVLSLSINNVKTLKFFRHNTKLRELYLRRNEVPDLSELGYLAKLVDLKVLWLSHNPVAAKPEYRATVLRMLPNLAKLDDKDVTAEEVEQAKTGGLEVMAKDDEDEDEGTADATEEAGKEDDAGGAGDDAGDDAGRAALTAIKALLPLLSPDQLAEVGAAVALQ